MTCRWWPPCWWLPTASATPQWAGMFQCKTRGQKGENKESPSKSHAAPSSAKEVVKVASQPLAPTDWERPATKHEEATAWGGGGGGWGRRRAGHCAEGGEEKLNTCFHLHHMTNWRREESRSASLWLKCNNAELELLLNTFIWISFRSLYLQTCGGVFPGGMSTETIHTITAH